MVVGVGPILLSMGDHVGLGSPDLRVSFGVWRVGRAPHPGRPLAPMDRLRCTRRYRSAGKPGSVYLVPRPDALDGLEALARRSKSRSTTRSIADADGDCHIAVAYSKSRRARTMGISARQRRLRV